MTSRTFVPISESEQQLVSRRVAMAEERTGVQIVCAVSAKSDVYPEIPWKAFALGAAAGGVTMLPVTEALAHWASAHLALLALVLTLGAGASLALLTVFTPPFARLFLDAERGRQEVLQNAQAMLLDSELAATQSRCGVLILASLFEHAVAVLPDRGVNLDREEAERIIAAMKPWLAHGRLPDAFDRGLGVLESLLAGKGHSPRDPADTVANAVLIGKAP